jgi:hypothetical protein
MADECPGNGKCHGPVKWCANCGEVDLVCDDPNCMQHERLAEKRRRKELAKREMEDAKVTFDAARQEYLEAYAAYEDHCDRPSRMVSRKAATQ